MSHDLPPPYYASAAALQTEHRDIASVIKQLSETIAKTDQHFYNVGTLLQGYPDVVVAPPDLKDSWRVHRQSFKDMIWEARRAATFVETRNETFIDGILPSIGDASKSKESKIERLATFIARAPPEFLTSMEAPNKCREINNSTPDLLKKYEENADKIVASAQAEIAKLEAERDKQKEKEKASLEKKSRRSWFSYSGPAAASPPPEHIDYDSMIIEEKQKIEAINNQRDNLKSRLADITFALNTIPDQVGHCFLTVWNHLVNDATHLKNRLEGSTTDPMPDIPVVTTVYREINLALKYYATNVNKT
ncbi:unnamed protein product [Rhizoctonia solani]|uniref:Uncharacterized protein n=1 Tax=Rhizoctonia solani TaxID=456999 RepID=A0A8H3HCL3_9AGAM|nr:unnamed protein product [Rhizoctonia solani]